jgi:hypothetical protein
MVMDEAPDAAPVTRETNPLRIDWNRRELADVYDEVERIRRVVAQPAESPINESLNTVLDAVENADVAWDGITLPNAYDAPEPSEITRLAATPSDRARVDGEVTQLTKLVADNQVLRDDLVLMGQAKEAAEQRALAAEAREREAIRQREISDRTAQDRRELADHNLRLAHEIEADLRAAEKERNEVHVLAHAGWMRRALSAEAALSASKQRVRALVEENERLSRELASRPQWAGGQSPIVTGSGSASRTFYGVGDALENRGLPAADGGSGEIG